MAKPHNQPLIIVGASARAAAQSALRGGWSPYCVDLFADRDLAAIAPVQRCSFHDYPDAIPSLIAAFPPGPVLLTGAMENHLDAVTRIAEQRTILGPSVAAIRKVRNPFELEGITLIPGVRPCKTRITTPMTGRLGRWLMGDPAWMLKPLRSSGGRGVKPWAGETLDDNHCLQERVTGRSLAAIYLADEYTCRLVGVTRQLTGDKAFHAKPYHYCGSVGPLALPLSVEEALIDLGRELMQRFSMRGVFGVDAILGRDNVIRPIEANPRYTASIEVLERAGAEPVLAALRSPHGTNEKRSAALPTTLHGKAILFAPADLAAPDLYDFFKPDEVADVPAIGEPIRAGQPICTLFARGESEEAVTRRLHESAANLYTRLK